MDKKAETLAAFNRGRNDIAAFAQDVLGIAVNAAQERWFRWINPAEDGWNWRYKFVIHVAANQIGKTVAIAILILWACNYKIGVAKPDDNDASKKDWVSRPYTWFHLAPSQQQAYLPLDDIVLIIQGAHPAQEKGKEKGLTFRWLPGLCQESKVEQYYRGLSFWNGALCQFRTTEDKAKALQGRRAAGITYDEAAFEDHLKSVVNETLMMRLIAMGGPLLLVGTPNGINDYYEFVESITQGAEEFPWRDEPTEHNPEERVWVHDGGVVCWSVINDNEGFGLTSDEIARMEANLDETTKEQQLRGAFLEPAEAFFVPAQAVLKSFKKQLPRLQLPKPGHSYIIAWDPSLASDPTAAVVLDVTKEPWTGVALKHAIKPLGIHELIAEMWAVHYLFNGARDERRILPKSVAITAFDATSMGGQSIKQLLAGMTPVRAVNFGGPSAKIQMLTNLRAALVTGKLVLPDDWMEAKRELMNYRLKDEKLRQDIVMALCVAADIASHGFSGLTSQRFDVSGRVSQTPTYR